MEALKRKKLDRLSAGVIGLLAVGLCAVGYLAFSPAPARSPRDAPVARNPEPVARVPEAVESPDPLPVVAPPPAPVQVLPFKIRGVIYSAGGGSVVFIEQGGKVSVFRVGDRLAEGWMVASIGLESAGFTRDGESASLNLERPRFKEPDAVVAQGGMTQSAPARSRNSGGASGQPGAGRGTDTMIGSGGVVRTGPPPDAARNSDATVVVDRSVAALGRQDPTALVEGVKCEPFMQKGQMEGIQINTVPSGSLAARYSLASGDRIVAVNNQPINSIEQAWNLYNQFRDSNVVNVTIIRAGQRKVVTYYVP